MTVDLLPKKLIDLDANWFTVNDRVVGVHFRCPIHDRVPGNPDFECRTRAYFTNPPDGGPPYGRTTWSRIGDTLETLRLQPSIRQLGYEDGGGCHWHGYVGGSGGEAPGIVTTLSDSR